jgi:pilus assembly protein FimV
MSQNLKGGSVRKSFLKALGYFACLAWSGMAGAVGFGGINVTSSLGQPLVAEIELVAVEKADKSSLNAHLASPDAFKGAGIDYPYALPKLKFSVETRANGDAYIKATSSQPVNEPFVSLLIELNWASGRLLREYTFLLDPPGFVAEQPAAAVKTIEPVVVAPAVVAPAPVEAIAPVPASAPQAEQAPVVAAEAQAASAPQAESPAPVAAASAVTAETAAPAEEAAKAAEPAPAENVVTAPEQVAPVPVPQKTESVQAEAAPVTTKRGDTLGKIANKTKAADVSLERMLVALYRSNAEAFDGKNMNRLRTGKILRMPESETLANLQQPEAAKEVRAQVADWNAYRQKLASANVAAKDQGAKQEVSGKISTSITDKAPVAKESAKEVLKLSKGDAQGDKAAAGGKAKSAEEKAIAKEEDSIAKAKALKEAEERTAMLEKSVKDMQRLVELKNQAAAKSGQAGAASAPASALPLATSSAAAASASAVSPASAAAAAKPKPKAATPKVITPEPSLIDEILGNPIYLGGGAAVLLGLGGLGFMYARRAKGVVKKEVKKAPKEEDIGGSTGRIAAPVMPSPETGDFTNAATAAPVADADEVDPIGEADLFLNFGRDVQAEEVLKEALNKDPSNNAVKLKLLSIYASRKDTKSFYVYALEINQSGDAASWDKAAAMGRELEPSNALYGGSGEAAPAAEAGDNTPPAVDFDLGFGGEAEQPAPASEVKTFDASVLEQTAVILPSELQAAQDAPMDFDVTGTHPGAKAVAFEEPSFEMPAMDFDVTGTHPGLKAVVPEEPKQDADVMDFDVTGLQSLAPVAAASAAAEPAAAMNLDDLVFDVTSTHTPAAQPAAAPAAEPAGLEFSIDFPMEKAEPAAAAPVKDVGLGEISLNLDDLATPAASAASEPKDERWQEVATKLDLAKAYQEMGDQAGAREILEEVVRDGDATQRETAQALLQQLA